MGFPVFEGFDARYAPRASRDGARATRGERYAQTAGVAAGAAAGMMVTF
jgi:hypothetical protein